VLVGLGQTRAWLGAEYLTRVLRISSPRPKSVDRAAAFHLETCPFHADLTYRQ